MSEFGEFFKIKFPNIQATIDQTHSEESILLKKACRIIWDARQAEIDQLKAQLNNMEACYIGKKRVRDQQKRIDEYKKLTTSIRNEFDLWSDDSEFADVIEAQIENLEALRGEL